MKITITGSLGHISKPLTQELVQKGHSITVISSNAERKKDIEALGAAAAIGTVEDVHFLTSAFKGADAVYCMLPVPDLFDPNLDLMMAANTVADNYARAIRQSGVKRVIHLSSIGAHTDKGNGVLLFHYNVERILKELPSDVAITHMRPVAFYYNLFGL
ncbi:MAG: SDR family oxidoreductase [Terriglobia bacterium]